MVEKVPAPEPHGNGSHLAQWQGWTHSSSLVEGDVAQRVWVAQAAGVVWSEEANTKPLSRREVTVSAANRRAGWWHDISTPWTLGLAYALACGSPIIDMSLAPLFLCWNFIWSSKIMPVMNINKVLYHLWQKVKQKQQKWVGKNTYRLYIIKIHKLSQKIEA